jgi:hypothetical protein
MTRLNSILVLSSLLAAAHASAGTITISPASGDITLNSGDLSSTVFGGSKPAWGPGSLSSVHTALNNAGIDTEGKVTFVAADTSRGLALLVLIDREVAPPPPASTGHLEMASSGNGAGMTYINNIASTVTMTTGPAGLRTASADFQWNVNGGGDAFAWANLQEGNTMSFRFLRPSGGTGLIEPATFQFVTWGQTGWELVSTQSSMAFDQDGTFGFGGRVVPLPSAVAMGALPLMAIGALRRRTRSR